MVYVYSHADDPDALCLLPDDEGGAMLAVEHLARLGRRRIAHVTGPEHFEAVRLRRSGYHAALAAAGLADGRRPLPRRRLVGGLGPRGGGPAVRRPAAPPDALFCGNDQIARGAADALRERGIAIPGEVAIVGFDNWEVMTLAARPPLTSIDMNLRALGREAGERLIDDDRRHADQRRLPPALLAGGAAVERRLNGKESGMGQFQPVRFVDVRIEGAVLARAPGHRADPDHPQPAHPARRRTASSSR